MFKWLPCFALLRRKSGNACCNHFFLQKNSGHALPCGSSSSHALNYSLSPTCGTASTWVHQPCTKLLHSRVTVDYPDRTSAVMPNEPSNHKAPLLSSSKLDGRSNHHFTLLPQLPLLTKNPHSLHLSLISFLISFLSLSFLSWMDAGALADVMSMALAKTIDAHGTKKRKHPTETTAEKLKAIALSKPPSPGSLIKQVQVMSLVDDLFLDLDRVFSSNTQY